MNVFEVTYAEGNWCFRQNGAAAAARVEPTKGRIAAFVDGYMSLRTGKVVFYLEDGLVEREQTYEANDLQMWAQSSYAVHA